MDMRAAWFSKLQVTNPDVRVLCTIGLGRRAEINIEGHPGTWGRVIRASTHGTTDVEDSHGMLYPFWPTLMNRPEIEYTYDPQERRVGSVTTNVTLLQTAGYVEKFFKKDHPQNAWLQLDLWLPGLTIEESLTIFSGPITSVQFDTEMGAVSLDAEDTYDGIPQEFPFTEDYLTNREFPGISEQLEGKAPRVFVLNQLRDAIIARPVSSDYREYYVCDPVMEHMPTEVFVGDQQVTTGQYKFRRGVTAASRQQYTKLIFSDRIENLGYSGEVRVRGGSGPTTDSPLQFFIDRQPGLKLTNRAKAYLADVERRKIYDYYVVINNKGSIIDLISNRLLPQSNMIGFFRNGELDIIRQGETTRIHNLAIGSQLLYRLPPGRPETNQGGIYNAIDVSYRRTYQGGVGKFSRFATLVDQAFGGRLGRFLARSEAIYGRRYLKLEASDLGNQRDAQRLGESILAQTAFPHRRFKYAMDYRHGLYLDINDRARLTDPDISANALPCRVVGVRFAATHIECTLQTEDGVDAF